MKHSKFIHSKFNINFNKSQQTHLLDKHGIALCADAFFSEYVPHKTRHGRRFFKHLGYPTYLIYPLATVKILAVVAILSRKSAFLKEWAYAGIFFDVILAFTAHTVVDGGGTMALAGIILVIVSRFLDGRVFKD